MALGFIEILSVKPPVEKLLVHEWAGTVGNVGVPSIMKTVVSNWNEIGHHFI